MTHAPRIERRGSGAGGKHKKPWPASIPQASLSRAALLHCRGPGVVAYPSGVALLLRKREIEEMTHSEKKEIKRRKSGVHEFRGYDECQWMDIAEAVDGQEKKEAESIAKTLKAMDEEAGE